MIEEKQEIHRGDVFWYNATLATGHLLGGYSRPGIIVQNDVGNKYSPTVVIVPVSSALHKLRRMPTHAAIGELYPDKPSMAESEQIRVINRTNLGAYITHLSDDVMRRVDETVRVELGL